MKRVACAWLLAAASLLAAPPLRAADGAGGRDTSGKVIALANNYAGNSWRQEMLADWDRVAKQAIAARLVKAAPSVTTSENSVTDEAQQIQNLVLRGVDAIVVDAASPSALNGAIHSACSAGIVVVSFDQIATEPCAYQIATDNRFMGEVEVNYLAGRLKGPAKLLEVRGLAGGAIDGQIHAGVLSALRAHPDLHIVGEARGNWTQTVAQREVAGLLPTLPKIDGVITQGGDGYGTAQAFLSSGRPLPVIIMGNRYDELTFWKAQRDAHGYDTMSISSAPGMVQMAFWVAQQVLAGRQVPKKITVPLLQIHGNDLDLWLRQTPDGGVTDANYTRDWTMAALTALGSGKALPALPVGK